MDVKFKILYEEDDLDPTPVRGSEHAVGYDVVNVGDDVIIQSQQRKTFSTGIAIAMPPGLECQVRPRSGMATKRGLTVINSPGTIDPDYRGEIKVCLANLGSTWRTVKHGERIAQLVFNKVELPELDRVQSLDDTERGEGGFGSTGEF